MVRITVLAVNTGTPVIQQSKKHCKNINEDDTAIDVARRRELSEHESVTSLAKHSEATLQEHEHGRHDLEEYVREHDHREDAPGAAAWRHDLEP